MIEMLSDVALATVQDLGRLGALALGVGTSGAMDPLALRAGNLLLGNPAEAAAVEFQVFPIELRFTADGSFALTGADCAATLDGAPVLPWWACHARAGQVLHLEPPDRSASRAYLCVAGGIDVPVVLGARATQLRGNFGGHQGRTLRQGDQLQAMAMTARQTGVGLVPASTALPFTCEGLPGIRVLPAAEHDLFTAASRTAFWGEAWRITPQSDRYGYRLAGPDLRPEAPIELRSHGIVPGVIQVPHGGQPIVQMRDAQPSGGYPKIGTVIEADLWRLGQAPIGSRIRFVACSWGEALAAEAANDAYLAESARLLALHESRRRA